MTEKQTGISPNHISFYMDWHHTKYTEKVSGRILAKDVSPLDRDEIEKMLTKSYSFGPWPIRASRER